MLYLAKKRCHGQILCQVIPMDLNSTELADFSELAMSAQLHIVFSNSFQRWPRPPNSHRNWKLSLHLQYGYDNNKIIMCDKNKKLNKKLKCLHPHSSRTECGSTSGLSSPFASSWGSFLLHAVASAVINLHCSPVNLLVNCDHPHALGPHFISPNRAASLHFPFSPIFMLMLSPVVQKERACSVWSRGKHLEILVHVKVRTLTAAVQSTSTPNCSP